jgi:hypothetical protein
VSDDLVPHTARHSFTPQEGCRLVVNLNDELVECAVTRVVPPNGVIAMIVSTPARKGSGFRRGEQIAVRRSVNALGQEEWVGLSEQQLGLAVEQERASRAAIGEIG